MSTICSQASTGVGRFRHSAAPATGDHFKQMVATLREWHRRSRERAQLAGLDDRMLRDIGINRTDALYLSSKPFWRE